MNNQDNDIEHKIKSEFREIMLCLKTERNSKFPIKGKELALKLSKTINYVSAIENGNEFPSFKLFLNYLLICNFDISPLKKLKIKESNNSKDENLASKRAELIEKTFSLSEDQISFVLEQIKLSENYKLKQK